MNDKYVVYVYVGPDAMKWLKSAHPLAFEDLPSGYKDDGVALVVNYPTGELYVQALPHMQRKLGYQWYMWNERLKVWVKEEID